MKKDKVIFRKFKDNQIIALLPDCKVNFGTIQSYMQLGQHSEASIDIINNTKLAKKSEYVDLFKELNSIGYNLQVIKRINYNNLSKMWT